MKVIFSDINGVLDDNKSHFKHFKKIEKYKKDLSVFKEIDESKIELLAKICIENDANLVFCSYWKHLLDLKYDKEMCSLLKSILIKLNSCGVKSADFTPKSNENDGIWYHEKSMEINEYLRMHPEVDSYCVIGDTYSELELHENNLILTTWDTDGLGNGGLLPTHQEEIKKILSKKRK